MTGTLIAISGPLQGSGFAVHDELTVGREKTNSVPVDDGALSRRHFSIRRAAGQFHIVDLGSRNGTFVNGIPVEERVLQPGDEIRAGRSVFVLLVETANLTPDAGTAIRRFSPESTVVLRRQDAIYLRPEEAVLCLPQASRTAQDFKTLLRVAAVVPAIRGAENLSRQVLELAGEAVAATHGAILLTGEAGDVRSSLSWARDAAAARACTPAAAVIERVVRERIGVLSEPLDMESSETGPQPHPQSLLAVPVVAFDRVLGVLYLETGGDRGFSRHDLQLVTGIAGIAAGALEAALHMDSLQRENQRLQAEINVEHNMVGDGARMRQVFQFIGKVAPAATTVLVHGESGTGKELVARAIHRNSPRATKPFVAINCAAVTETLLESELFGHEKGSFTGAIAQRKGKFEEADGGTLFLDEVGELAQAMQAKLLRVLQEREFHRVGGNHPVRVDVRLIAATNRDLEKAVRDGLFRQDLYYRLNVVSLRMPALRDRREDIPALAEWFAQKHGTRLKRRVAGISAPALRCLEQYDWPGNVREFENAIERAIVLGSTEWVLPEDLPEAVAESVNAAHGEAAGSTFHELVKEAKKRVVLEALERAKGSIAEAARSLGLHPNNLHRLIRTLDMRGDLAKGREAGP